MFIADMTVHTGPSPLTQCWGWMAKTQGVPCKKWEWDCCLPGRFLQNAISMGYSSGLGEREAPMPLRKVTLDKAGSVSLLDDFMES